LHRERNYHDDERVVSEGVPSATLTWKLQVRSGRDTVNVEAGDNWAVATRIVLVRHGLIDTASRLCGSFDVPLTPAGRAQIEAIVRQRPAAPIPDALYTSTLRRASDVAAVLGRAWALQPRLAEWAREIHCGEVEGMPLAHLQRTLPELWARNLAQDDDSFAWPGGEPYAAFRERVLAGLSATAAAHAGGRVAVVTHAGVISQILGVIRHRRAAVWAVDRPDPFTATEVTWENGSPTAVLRYNDPGWY
jgi:broad specificity phosphatase PhoE